MLDDEAKRETGLQDSGSHKGTILVTYLFEALKIAELQFVSVLGS